MRPVTPRPAPAILGISFDGFAISGIVNEFLHAAKVFHGKGFRALCDLGYDITLGRRNDLGWDFLPPWVEPVRTLGDVHPESYTPDIVRRARADAIGGRPVTADPAYHAVSRALAATLVSTFLAENVRLLIVENGTLPDNPLFTEALYEAIGEYGALTGLRKFVLWRDHDLMWSSEPRLYGVYPYPGVRRPEAGEHVHYAVTTDWMRKRMLAWAPSIACHVIPCRFSPLPSTHPVPSFRAAYGIPHDALLVARCTRVAPQKSIERDLRLVHALQLRLAAAGDPRRVFLVVAGPTGEDPREFERLRTLEHALALGGQVVWADGLLPMNASVSDPARHAHRFSVRDLLAEADLSSFLTTYDYEGFGMPPGEAMTMGVPFVSTTYELYHDVYGSRGAVAPLLPIDRDSAPDAPMPESFVTWTMAALTDPAYRAGITARNLQVVQRFFSLDALAEQLGDLFPDAREEREDEPLLADRAVTLSGGG